MSLKKASCLLAFFTIAPFLCAFQADVPGDSLGIVAGGGQDYYEGSDAHMLQYLNYWYLNIPYKHVFNNGNMAVGAVFTYMHLQQQTRTEMIRQTDNVSEFRLVPQWIHNPSRYFGYSAGLFLSITDAHKSYVKYLQPGMYYIMPSLELRAGALDLIYFSFGIFNPDLAGDVSGPIAVQIIIGHKLIPYTQLSEV